jgi:hypothetical protein
MLFAGAAAVTACSSSSATTQTGKDSGQAEKDSGQAEKDSGQAEKDSGVTRDTGAGFSDGEVRAAYGVMVAPEGGGAPLYGVAAQPDSGTGEHHEGGAVAAYGVMIPPGDAGTH